MFMVFHFIFGCAGNYANIRNLSESESKAIQQELLDNWSDYDISYLYGVIVFDPKTDDKKILVSNSWNTVKDQETWTQIVNGTITDPVSYNINMLWGEPIREIWVYNQLYGYIIILLKGHYMHDSVTVMVVDDNAVRLGIL